MHQAQACFPYEAGGFLGGKENNILGVLPVPNKKVGGRDEFSLWEDDFGRAYTFFEKHNLELAGVYHTHPGGIAYPSDQDIKATSQKRMKYMFIIGMADRYKPDLRVYTISGGVVEIPIRVVSDKGIVVMDLFSSGNRQSKLTPENLHLFHEYIKRVIREETESGRKGDFGWDASSFSTLA